MNSKDYITLVKEALPQSYDYSSYRQLVNDLFRQGKTTGSNHSGDMLAYTEMNIARMNKWDKHFKLPPALAEKLAGHDREEVWLVITEAWCGDAAHAVPVMTKMAEASPAIDLHFVLRDENLQLMDRFLTNGGHSIPKLIRMDAEDHGLLSTWGPRPARLQQEYLAARERGDDMMEFKKQMQIWYARDRGQTIMYELSEQLATTVV